MDQYTYIYIHRYIHTYIYIRIEKNKEKNKTGVKNQPPPSLVHLWLLRGLHHRSVQAEVVARSKAQQPQQSHLGATGSGKGEKNVRKIWESVFGMNFNHYQPVH